jgi:hypothetical protein
MTTTKAACTKLKLKSLFATFGEIVERPSDFSKFAARRSKGAELVIVVKRVESGCAAVVVVSNPQMTKIVRPRRKLKLEFVSGSFILIYCSVLKLFGSEE